MKRYKIRRVREMNENYTGSWSLGTPMVTDVSWNNGLSSDHGLTPGGWFGRADDIMSNMNNWAFRTRWSYGYNPAAEFEISNVTINSVFMDSSNLNMRVHFSYNLDEDVFIGKLNWLGNSYEPILIIKELGAGDFTARLRAELMQRVLHLLIVNKGEYILNKTISLKSLNGLDYDELVNGETIFIKDVNLLDNKIILQAKDKTYIVNGNLFYYIKTILSLK